MKSKIFILASGVAALATSAHGLVLDDFSTGSGSYSTTTGTFYANDAGSMVGGDRTLQMTVESNLYGLLFSIDISSGVLSFNSQSGVDALGVLGYGYSVTGQTVSLEDMNLDLSDQTAFQVELISRDSPATVGIVLRSSSGDGGFHYLPMLLTGSAINTTQVLTFNFADFNAGVNFSDIDQIDLVFDTSNTGDLAITNFEAVPEPATMLALGAGAALIAAKRRRKA